MRRIAPLLSRRLSAGLAALGLASAASHDAAFASSGPPDELRVSLNADIRGTNVGVDRDDNTDAVMLHVVEGLVALREDGSVGPMLAERIESSADGLTFTFPLRDGVRFHNGAPLAAGDVLWAWRRYLDPKTGWRCRAEFAPGGRTEIAAVEARDDRTVVFTLKRPSALFLATMARTDCGAAAVVHRSSVEADGRWRGAVGTGPYRVAEWRRAQHVLLERFDGYSARQGGPDGYAGGKHARVKRVRFVVIPDASAARTALLSGGIDVLAGATALDARAFASRRGITVATSPTTAMQTLLMQTADPLLKNTALRRAIAMAVDSAGIADATTDGRAPANNSVVPSTSPFHGPVQQAGFIHDPARAKALLAEAGYRGETLRILANRRYPECYDAAIIVHAMLRAVGIRAELDVLDWATQLDRFVSGRYQLMLFPYSARMDAALSFDSVMGAKSKTPNRVWDVPEDQALLTRAFAATDTAERQALFDELHRRMLAEAPLIVLFNLPDYTAHSDAVHGLHSWLAGKPRLWDVTLKR